MTHTKLSAYRLMLSVGIASGDIRDGLERGDALGEIAWNALPARQGRENEALHAFDGWPTCGCTGCGCTAAAVTTDDAGGAVCAVCCEYTVDDAGEIHCMNMGDVEAVTECCGAGGQMRTYTRLRPPSRPTPDPDGKWACYWDTVGDDAHVVSRHESLEAAKQAVLSHDWPPPGDHTAYLCGYEVRELVDGDWVLVER